ncbi:MAG: hypothetical protein LUH21_26240 [Clostridiales bacterium]|nr:hypothetical protein [Clostridiales bacterium]
MNGNLMNWGYGYDPMQYEIQRAQNKLEEEIRQDQRELFKTEKKAMIREKTKLWGMKERLKVKAQIEEAHRSVYECVSISGDGKIEVKTKNLEITSSSRILSDLHSPELIRLRNGTELTEEIFLVVGFVKNRTIKIFLLPDRCGNGSYLLRKFNIAGVSIFAPRAKAKAYLSQLLCVLILNSKQEKVLAENPGWQLLPDGNIELVEEGGLLWPDAKKMSQ